MSARPNDPSVPTAAGSASPAPATAPGASGAAAGLDAVGEDWPDEEAPVSRLRRRARLLDEPLVNLTSMVDVLAVLMFFLLTMYSGGGYLTSLPGGMKLPDSGARAPLGRNLEVYVLKDQILLDRQPVGDDPAALDESDELLLPGLSAARAAEAPPPAATEADGSAASGSEEGAPAVPAPARRVTILADREIPFRQLKKVLYTVDRAGFREQSLAVRQVD